MTGLTSRVHSKAREEGGVAALAWWRARRRRHSAGVGEVGRGRAAELGGLKRLNGRVGCWAGWARS
jgi:hypothetical protein